MHRALELAARGLGSVEPNPPVGCVIADGDRIIAEGWHRRFGEDHAEVDALKQVPSDVQLGQATLYVTLEPCCHTGKTPPCTQAILAAGIRRVVVAVEDPFPRVAGQGLQQLREAGIEVETGVCEQAGRRLLAPYLKLQQNRRPWMIAKWAMTLDGKLASRSGSSQWISNEQSRARVHELRGRMDGILVGSGTAISDDPQLTARPPGPRTATRIVFDSEAKVATKKDAALIQTARQVPVWVFTGPSAEPDRVKLLEDAGVEIYQSSTKDRQGRILEMLDELGKRQMTNVFVEGGAGLLGALWDAEEIDEVHAFIAPKLIGGAQATGVIDGLGIEHMQQAVQLVEPEFKILGDNVYVHGRVATAR